MSNVTKYAFTGLLGVALITLVFMPFLDSAGRRGLVIAALIALPIQIIAFSAMLSFRSNWNRFLAVWVGGTLLRMVVIGLAAFVAIRLDLEGLAPMLLALAGFFFGLLLIEPIYLRSEHAETL
ncbi:MAG: hypothetical protein CME14_04885 [Gemmatimonadetes bacterium]|nr:hypothetical protein [Gemmatimonadota bacterium]